MGSGGGGGRPVGVAMGEGGRGGREGRERGREGGKEGGREGGREGGPPFWAIVSWAGYSAKTRPFGKAVPITDPFTYSSTQKKKRVQSTFEQKNPYI